MICATAVFFIKKIKSFLLMPFFFWFSIFACVSCDVEKCAVEKPGGLVAFWDFSDSFKSKCGSFTLIPCGNIEISNGGPISGKSADFDGKSYLYIPYSETGELNVMTNKVTVIAWIKWLGGTGFIGGMWNEYLEGGKRQYGLFVSLPYYNGGAQVCGHISKTGKATPPFPYSIDYSASAQKVPIGKWACAAFTYDGKYIRSYLDGKFVARKAELINNTKGLPGYPDGLVQSKNPYYFPDGIGDNGSDFTVGAVLLKKGMGNFFKGRIGGLAVYNRALSDSELISIAQAYSLK